jgi:cell division protein FtsL
MTATQYDRAAVAPTRAPAPTPRPRPPLRVVTPEETRKADRRRRARLRVAVMVLVGVGGLFGLVASHVVLTQGQFRLQQVEAKANEEQARYERLRLEVAELESPQRIVAAAQERLGMVTPPGVRYLSPAGLRGEPPAAPDKTPRNQASPQSPDWTAVKPHLASRP